MIGLATIAAGWVLLVVAAVLLFGVPALAVAGVVMLVVGAFVDLDSLRGADVERR